MQLYDQPDAKASRRRAQPTPTHQVGTAANMALQQAALNVHPAPSLMDQAQSAVNDFENTTPIGRDRSNILGQVLDPWADVADRLGQGIMDFGPAMQDMWSTVGQSISGESGQTPLDVAGQMLQGEEDWWTNLIKHPVDTISSNPLQAIMEALAIAGGAHAGANFLDRAGELGTADYLGGMARDETGAIGGDRSFMGNDAANGLRPMDESPTEAMFARHIQDLTPEELDGIAQQLGLDEESAQHLMSQSRQRPALPAPLEAPHVAPRPGGPILRGQDPEAIQAGYTDSTRPIREPNTGDPYSVADIERTSNFVENLAKADEANRPAQAPTISDEAQLAIEDRDRGLADLMGSVPQGADKLPEHYTPVVSELDQIKQALRTHMESQGIPMDRFQETLEGLSHEEADALLEQKMQDFYPATKSRGIPEDLAPPKQSMVDPSIPEVSTQEMEDVYGRKRDLEQGEADIPGFLTQDKTGTSVTSLGEADDLEIGNGQTSMREHGIEPDLIDTTVHNPEDVNPLGKNDAAVRQAVADENIARNKVQAAGKKLSNIQKARKAGASDATYQVWEAAQQRFIKAKEEHGLVKARLDSLLEDTVDAEQAKVMAAPKKAPKRVAVVGSRAGQSQAEVNAYIDSLPTDGSVKVVSGGAEGPDAWAVARAKERGIPTQEFPANWNRQPDGSYDKSAGFKRNGTIVANSDEVVAFWDGESRGTKDTITKAKGQGKKVTLKGTAQVAEQASKTEGETHWFSTESMTVSVTTDANGIITKGAPIVRKFIGQPLENLERWLKKQKGFRTEADYAPEPSLVDKIREKNPDAGALIDNIGRGERPPEDAVAARVKAAMKKGL